MLVQEPGDRVDDAGSLRATYRQGEGAHRVPQHSTTLRGSSTTLSAKPPRAVSLYLTLMSAPVSRMVLIALSSDTWWVPSPCRAIRAAVIALIEPTALRSMHGICTNPPTGSQVSPRLCSIPISAAFSTCAGDAPSTSASPAAAMEQAGPTSPWQPTSAPEMEAFSLNSSPIAPAVSRNRTTPSSEKLLMNWR